MKRMARLVRNRNGENLPKMSERGMGKEIDAVAADWAARVDDLPLEPSEQGRLDTWVAEDIRHLGAYARARSLLLHARCLKALGADFQPDKFLENNKPAGDVKLIDLVGSAPFAQPMPRRAFLRRGAVAAVASAAAFAGFSWQAAAHTYTTELGEIRLVPLPDGSSMTLNTSTTARVNFGDTERRIELLEGEALFDVVHDGSRPFLVNAASTEIRALGTSFTVRHLPDRPIEIVVRQGIVELDPPSSSLPSQYIAANHRLAIAPGSARVAPVSMTPTEIARQLAWREGMLSFEDISLQKAAAEFARYSDTRIVFSDKAIGDETITGLFAANNPSGFAKSAALSLDLRTEQKDKTVLFFR